MKKKFSFAVIFFIAGVTLAVFITVSAVRESYRSRTIEQEVENLKQEAQRIENENKELTDKIAYLETPEFQEKIAKEKLNMQKQDESVIVVKPGVDKQSQVSGAPDETVQPEQSVENYQKWWNFFFKY
jgi:cell division protein FtsL